MLHGSFQCFCLRRNMSLLAGNMSMCKIDTFGEESAMINNDIYPAMTSACPRLCTKVILNRVIELKWLQQFYTLGDVPAHDCQLQEQRGRGGHCVWSWQLCASDSVRKQCANEQSTVPTSSKSTWYLVDQLCICLGGSRERAKHPFLHTGGHH